MTSSILHLISAKTPAFLHIFYTETGNLTLFLGKPFEMPCFQKLHSKNPSITEVEDSLAVLLIGDYEPPASMDDRQIPVFEPGWPATLSCPDSIGDRPP